MMGRKAGDLRRMGLYFPITLFRWSDGHKYTGEEIGHLWFSRVVGSDSYGNLVVTWRGPMDVKLEYAKDQTERNKWQEGTRIRGPDLFHTIAEFPQVGVDLPLMYAYQAMLADELASRILELGHPVRVEGTDIYMEDRKLNVGVCCATPTSCTMHLGVNLSLEGEPSIPTDVKAASLSELLDGGEEEGIALMEGVVSRWATRIDEIQLKTYKTA